MNEFFTKLAMLVMFLLAVSTGWAALMMVFPVSLINVLLGIVSAFFLLRAFELADRINKLGPYSKEDDNPDSPSPGSTHHERREDEDTPPDEG